MKNLLMILFAVVMALCLTACAGENSSSVVNSEVSQSTEISQSSTTKETDSSSEVSQTSSTMSTENVSSTENSETSTSLTTESSSEKSEVSAPSSSTTTTESEPPAEPAEDDVKILVAYFSATNNTKGVAQKLADGLGADIYEITPEQPYTSEDLAYGNSQSRTSIEMNDPNARPAIAGSVENMEQYDIVLIGYPIWWGNAPRIMNTFIESYDFSGKTLAAFCTSASSGFGNSDSALRSASGGAVWLDGKRFSAGASADEILAWADEIGVN